MHCLEVIKRLNSPENTKKYRKPLDEVTLKQIETSKKNTIRTAKQVRDELKIINSQLIMIKSRGFELLELFNSNDPEAKLAAYQEAVRLSKSIPGLKEKKTELDKMLPEIQRKEMAGLESLVFPVFDI